MNKLLRIAGVFLLVCALVCALAACGQTAQEQPTQTVTETQTEPKEITVETPPPSPTPTPTPTPSVPPVAVTTVPMPMPSVSPTPGVTTPEATATTSGPHAHAFRIPDAWRHHAGGNRDDLPGGFAHRFGKSQPLRFPGCFRRACLFC